MANCSNSVCSHLSTPRKSTDANNGLRSICPSAPKKQTCENNGQRGQSRRIVPKKLDFSGHRSMPPAPRKQARGKIDSRDESKTLFEPRKLFFSVCPAPPQKPASGINFQSESKRIVPKKLDFSGRPSMPPAPRKQAREKIDSQNESKTFLTPTRLLDCSPICPSAPRKRMRVRSFVWLIDDSRSLLKDFWICPPAPKKRRLDRFATYAIGVAPDPIPCNLFSQFLE